MAEHREQHDWHRHREPRLQREGPAAAGGRSEAQQALADESGLGAHPVSEGGMRVGHPSIVPDRSRRPRVRGIHLTLTASV